MKPVKHWLLLVRSSNLNKTGLDIYAKAALGNQELLFLFLFVSLVLHDYFPTFALYVIPKNMTYLDTDKQTRADLSITEGIYDEYPLYSLFSKTETKNGKRLMLDWITSPLNDISVIRKRQEAIAWQELPELPLDEEELDFIEYYLEYRDQIRRPNILVSLTSAFDRLLRHDAQRYVIKRGVPLTIRLLNQLESLRTNLPGNAPLLLKELAQSIQHTIYSSELKEVVELYKKEKSPSSYIIDKYDYLFRCIHLELIRGLLSHIYILDVCRTAHRIAISKGFCCRPEMTEAMDLSITGFVHPFTEGGRMNDWKMTNGNNICILTGSNMAGKSTYMRQVALITLMAQIGSFVPATSAHIGVVDKIFTRVGASDDLSMGQSTFMVEMMEVANILKEATANSLVVLDEIGRGTSTYDGLSIAWAVAEYIENKEKCGAKTLFATHYHELIELADKQEGIKNYSIAVKEKGEDIIFLRKIVEGGTDESYGIHVARLAGVPKVVTKRADEILTSLERKSMLSGKKQEKENKKVVEGQFDMFNFKLAEIAHEIDKINLNELTPIDALNTLMKIKEKMK